MCKVTHQAGAYPGFCSIKQLGVFLLPWMLVHRRVTPSIKFAGTYLYTSVLVARRNYHGQDSNPDRSVFKRNRGISVSTCLDSSP